MIFHKQGILDPNWEARLLYKHNSTAFRDHPPQSLRIVAIAQADDLDKEGQPFISIHILKNASPVVAQTNGNTGIVICEYRLYDSIDFNGEDLGELQPAISHDD